MAYFNHAFNKVFLGTGATRSAGPAGPTNPHSSEGFITTASVPSVEISKLNPGYYGFVDASWNTVNTAGLSGNNCCPLTLVSSSLLGKDSLNQYIGGYKETNKSKLINPKYVQKFYRVDSNAPQQAVLSIGTTPSLATAGAVPDNYLGGTTEANCAYTFLCDETYYLRIDLKGSPALRFLNHNAYQTLSAYTGCCAGPTPEAVDPTTVFILWATALIQNNYLKDFVAPVVYDTTGTPWYAPGTTVTLDGTSTPVTSAEWWTAYVPVAPAPGQTAGMRLFGAYVETKFGNCTFQVTDFYEKEPIRIYASLVDYNGDPCVFEGLCVYNDCRGIQGMGFGETVVRDLILSQSYLQNYFASNDMRVREITQGYDILNSVSRNALYTRYYILHSVPRFNNPTGMFDNDRYMLEIITNGTVAALETFVNTWLDNCPNCITFETSEATLCEITPDTPPAP